LSAYSESLSAKQWLILSYFSTLATFEKGEPLLEIGGQPLFTLFIIEGEAVVLLAKRMVYGDEFLANEALGTVHEGVSVGEAGVLYNSLR